MVTGSAICQRRQYVGEGHGVRSGEVLHVLNGRVL